MTEEMTEGTHVALPPGSIIAALVVIFAIGLWVLSTSPRRSAGEYVGAVLTLLPVLSFIALLIVGAGR